jgi:ribosomal protein S18 acetylase RimI-like enzyme
MLSYEPAQTNAYDELLSLLRDQASGYLQATLNLMQMTWDQFAHRFRSVGQVYGIYQDGQLAGFYWIEEREDTLHLHGLILKSEFQGQGIGSQVLAMLAASYRSRVKAIELGVHRSNERAIALYERTGFETARTLDDLGFLVMQKPLHCDRPKGR